MLRHAEVDGTSITLQVEHKGYPWWLIATRGTGEHGEVWSRIFDNQPAAEEVYDFLAMRFGHDHLRKIIPDERRYARLMRLLGDLETDPFFCRAVNAKDERLIESLLGWILKKSESLG